MALVKTLAERKRAQVEAIQAGIARLREDLTEYGRAHGGKFVLYGSAVSGRIHYESDVDIIVDFDEDDLAAVEATCRRLKLNVQPKSWCKEGFLRKNCSEHTSASVSDAKWFEVDADIEPAINHFRTDHVASKGRLRRSGH